MSFKLLKKIALLNLIILLLPFFQTCSDKELMKNSLLKNSPLSEVVKTIHQDSIFVMTGSDSKEKEFQYTFDELKKRNKKLLIGF